MQHFGSASSRTENQRLLSKTAISIQIRSLWVNFTTKTDSESIPPTRNEM